jgi:hypothetical protein
VASVGRSPYHRPHYISQSKRTKSQKAATYLCTNSYGFSSRGTANHMAALGMGVVHEHSLGRRRVRLRDYARFTALSSIPFTASMTKANWKPTGSCVECESIALLVCQVPPFDKYHYRKALLLVTSYIHIGRTSGWSRPNSVQNILLSLHID